MWKLSYNFMFYCIKNKINIIDFNIILDFKAKTWFIEFLINNPISFFNFKNQQINH